VLNCSGDQMQLVLAIHVLHDTTIFTRPGRMAESGAVLGFLMEGQWGQ